MITKQYRVIIMIILLPLFISHLCSAAQIWNKNGFDLSNASIDHKEIFSGGPPRDGIPAIDKPRFISIQHVDFLKDDDIVIGMGSGKKAKAYPTRILVWHEIVNDTMAGKPIMVTYCPLCGTAMVFERYIEGKQYSFGVSGLLYQSDVLMYDRETESLWSQLAMQAISGPLVGQKLNWLNSEHLSWKTWREKYPHGKVLSTQTGYQRNYKKEAYASYFTSKETMFPVAQKRNELAKKDWVIGVIMKSQAKAYPVTLFSDEKHIKDSIAGEEISISYNAAQRFPQITNKKGEHVPSVLVFWFAWQAFYPETLVWLP